MVCDPRRRENSRCLMELRWKASRSDRLWGLSASLSLYSCRRERLYLPSQLSSSRFWVAIRFFLGRYPYRWCGSWRVRLFWCTSPIRSPPWRWKFNLTRHRHNLPSEWSHPWCGSWLYPCTRRSACIDWRVLAVGLESSIVEMKVVAIAGLALPDLLLLFHVQFKIYVGEEANNKIGC